MFQMLLLLCVLFFTGCSSGLNNGYDGDDVAPKTPTSTIDFKGAYAVIIANSNNTADVKVYVVHSGTTFRLGLATGLGTTRLNLNKGDLDNGYLTLALEPMGKGGQIVTIPVQVGFHNIVHLDIESSLSTSAVNVWYDGR